MMWRCCYDTDHRRLALHRDGDRQTAAVRLPCRHYRRHNRHPHWRTSHLRVHWSRSEDSADNGKQQWLVQLLPLVARVAPLYCDQGRNLVPKTCSITTCSDVGLLSAMFYYYSKVLKGVYTMIHVRRTCTSYRCTAYMYHSVNIHVRCFKHAENNAHVPRKQSSHMCGVHVRCTCAPYMYHSINSPLLFSDPLCATKHGRL